MPLFWLIVLTRGKEAAGIPDVPGSVGQGPLASLGLLQQVLLWRTGSCLPRDGDLFWTDPTLGRARVLFSPEVANQMKKTYVGHFTLISRKHLGPEL